MTNSEILLKVLKKAIKNGYSYLNAFIFDWWTIEDNGSEGIIIEWGDSYGIFTVEYERIIFSHKFAKVFFTNDIILLCRNCKKELYDRDNHRCLKCNKEFIVENDVEFVISWQYHLQKMVLEPEPLKYIERFLDEK